MCMCNSYQSEVGRAGHAEHGSVIKNNAGKAVATVGESNSLCHGLFHFAGLLYEQKCYITQ